MEKEKKKVTKKVVRPFIRKNKAYNEKVLEDLEKSKGFAKLKKFTRVLIKSRGLDINDPKHIQDNIKVLYNSGMTHRNIARVLNIPPSAVGRRLKAVKGYLGPYEV